MESEFLQLAREAVAAMQLQAAASGSTSWVEIAQLAVSGGGLLAILVGLKRMGEAGHRRDREIDEMAAAFAQQAETLGKIGTALDRQGEAMTQAFTQQGEVLAELLRRTPA